MEISERQPSEIWLKARGLTAKKLDLNYILRQLGFGHVKKFEGQIRKTVCARYGQKLFQKYADRDGKVFNVIGSEDTLLEFVSRLKVVKSELTTRLQTITSGSYRVFGLISAKKPLIVTDISTNDPQRRELFFNEIKKVIEEQLTQVTKFNLMSTEVSESNVLLSDFSQDLEENSPSLNVTTEALGWLEKIRSVEPKQTDVSSTLAKVAEDQSLYDSVVLFVENDISTDYMNNIDKILTDTGLKLNLVSFNNSDTDNFGELNRMISKHGGKFRAFSINETEEDVIAQTTSFYGSTPEGASLDEDAFLIWSELEDCKQTIDDVDTIYERLKTMRETYEQEHLAKTKKNIEVPKKKRAAPLIVTSDNYLSSEQWLKKYGIPASKLDFYTFLAGHVFKHCNGVVDIKTEPNDDDPDFKSPADEKSVLVNAKYCRKFVHIIWKDGEIRHVLLTGSVYRDFMERATNLGYKIQLRMNFLKEGSRELFGTICEDSIYILIDTSSSMEAKIDLVVKKLHQLMDEQIRDKRSFNIVCFNSEVVPWRSKMVEVTDSSIQAAKTWTKYIATSGSTNTLDALQFALSDKKTQGVYLLTDGRPDQPEKAILQLIHVHTEVPVHTISFNCFDKAANDFLHHLADETGGRFHLYQDVPYNSETDGPRPHVSLDLVLLQKEFDSLKQVQRVIRTLRQECELMEKYKEPDTVPKAPPKTSSDNIDQTTLAMRRKAAAEKKRHKTQKAMTCLSTASSQSDIRKESLRKSIKGESDNWMLREDKELFADEKQLTQKAKAQLLRREEIKKKLGETSAMTENRTLGASQFTQSETDGEKQSIKSWLKKNSLVAKKLTLIDVLKPTIIRHSAKYIPVLDKHVTGKVFEDIFPDFYIQSGNKDEIKYVNPTAVDLESYEQKVEKQIRIYKHKLNKVVWEALSEEAKLKHFDGKGPVSFFNNKEKMMKLLEEYEWPVDDQEIDLLLDEIKLGYELIQKSTDLRNVNVENNTNESFSEDSEQFQKSRPKTTVEVKNRSRNEAAKTSTAREREPNIIDLSPVAQRGYSNVQGVLHGERAHGSSKSAVPSAQKRLIQESRGLPVIARNEIDGYYYPATILESESSNSAIVKFGNEQCSNVETKHIIPRAGAISGPQLQVGDFVLAQKPKDPLQKFHPGIILALPSKSEPQPHYYTIVLWNRKQVASTRKLIVKVSQQRFQETATYIHDMHNISLELQRNKGDLEQNLTITKYGSKKTKQMLNRTKEKKVEVSPYEKKVPPLNKSSRKTKNASISTGSSSFVEELSSRSSQSTIKSANKTKPRKVTAIKKADKKQESVKPEGEELKKSSSSTSSKKYSSFSDDSKKSNEVKIPSADSDDREKPRSGSVSGSKSRSKSDDSKTLSRSSSSSSSSFKRSDQDRSPTRMNRREDSDEEIQDDTEQQVSEIRNELEDKSDEERKSESESSDGDVNETQGVADTDEPEIAAVMQTTTTERTDDRPKSPTPNNLLFGVEDTGDESRDLNQPANLILNEVEDSIKDQFVSMTSESERAEYLQKLLESTVEQNMSRLEKNQNRVQQQIRAAESLHTNADENNIDYIINATGMPMKASKLQKTEQILAKWGDDQWYYKHYVVYDMHKGYYAVRDSFNSMDILSRLEMISEENDADDIIRKDDYVLALYPYFDDERFGPAKVIQGNLSNSLVVEFFDDRVATIDLENCYKIAFHRFANEMSKIMTVYSNWVTKPVIFKCDSSKRIQIGIIWDFDPQQKHQMVIRDAKSDLSFQPVENLFGPIRKGMTLTRGEHVLAPVEDNSADYVPGVVVEVKVGSRAHLQVAN